MSHKHRKRDRQRSNKTRVAKQSAGNPASPTSGEATRSPSKLRWILGLGLLAIGLAGGYLYYVSQDPALDLPQPDLSQVEPAVKEAVEIANRNVLQAPASADAWGTLGLVYLAYEIRDAAALAFRQALQRQSDNYRWPYYLAITLAETDRQQALDYLAQAASFSDAQPAVLCRYAEFLLDQRELDQAESVFQRVLQRRSEEPRASLGMARIAFARNDLAASRQWAEQAVARAPGRSDVLELLAQVYHRLGERKLADQAMRQLQQLSQRAMVWPDPLMSEVALIRRDATVLAVMAEETRRVQRFEQSIELWKQVIQLQPRSPFRRARLAVTHIEAGQPDQAERVVDQALADFPNSEQLMLLKSQLRRAQQDWEEALVWCDRAIQQKADYDEALVEKARLHAQRNQTSAALDAYRHAVNVAPQHVEARMEFAKLLIAKGQKQQAREQLLVLARLAPEWQETQTLLESLSD